jgi:threonine synthase
MPRFVSHLEGAIDGERLPADRLLTVHKDRPIWVRYDLAAVSRALTKPALRSRPESLWRYRELLPYFDESDVVTLGERISPLLSCPRLGTRFGLEDLWIKDESQLPTGTFKSRGMALAITMAKRFGVQRVALPTAGNAGGAAAAYAARAGLECFVFMPDDTPIVNQYECRIAGAKTFLVNGLINDCGRIVREGKQRMGWFDLSTLKEPYRLEGKKTMGLELAEQFDWMLPDVILYPTGGGTGLVGMWKAFEEMAELGWLADPRGPRMVSVQAKGCAPIVKAFESNSKTSDFWEGAETIASGLRIPKSFVDQLILRDIRKSHGTAIAVSDAEILDAQRTLGAKEGIFAAPEGAATIAALTKLKERGTPHFRGKDRLLQYGERPQVPELDSHIE